MNYEEINALTVNDTIYILFDRLITDKSLVPENEFWIIYPEIVDPELSMYEQVNVYETLTKPTLQACEDELVIYKAELIVEEDSRLAEIARKDDLVSRFLVICSKDAGVPAFRKCDSIKAITEDTANAKKYMYDLINDVSRSAEAEALMTEIEAKDVELTTAQNLTQQIETLYNTMNDEVYAAMTVIFQTSKSDSATATYETWKLIKETSSAFTEIGLVCTYSDIPGIQFNDPLNTVELLTAFVDEMLLRAFNYGVWRTQRLQQFRNEKTAILP